MLAIDLLGEGIIGKKMKLWAGGGVNLYLMRVTHSSNANKLEALH